MLSDILYRSFLLRVRDLAALCVFSACCRFPLARWRGWFLHRLRLDHWEHRDIFLLRRLILRFGGWFGLGVGLWFFEPRSVVCLIWLRLMGRLVWVLGRMGGFFVWFHSCHVLFVVFCYYWSQFIYRFKYIIYHNRQGWDCGLKNYLFIWFCQPVKPVVVRGLLSQAIS